MSFAPVVLSEFFSRPNTLVTTFVAQQPGGGDPGGQGQDFGKSSPLGLLVLILFLIAVVFLVRSMSKHLKRVPASFDEATGVEETKAGDDQAGANAEGSLLSGEKEALRRANSAEELK